MVEITSKRDGFRRCGLAHAMATTNYPADRFSADELSTLQQEQMLVVTIVPDKPGGGGSKEKISAAEAIARAGAAESVDLLDAMLLGETRPTVLAAIESRRQDLVGAE